jgi:tRNA dimethylallyltransferase
LKFCNQLVGGFPATRPHLGRDAFSHLNPVIAIVGPTASGKSTLGIEVALQINGEIINCDSVQVYKEIQIATAKVPLDERKGVPHHLIDFVSPDINYTAGEWAREAAAKIEEIENRGRVPLLVGGTGFYLRALRHPFFVSPPTDESLRRRLNRIRERHGAEHLHRLLQRIDPDAAGQLYPRDWPRVQRAIEVYLQTGRSIVDQQPVRPEPHESSRRLRILALNPPRAELYKRINERTEAHFRAGLVEEVQQLLDRGFSPFKRARSPRLPPRGRVSTGRARPRERYRTDQTGRAPLRQTPIDMVSP